MRDKVELRNILFRYMDEYYKEFPEEKGNYPNWGELEWEYEYPDIFPALYGYDYRGGLSREEAIELNNFADKAYDAWRSLNESTKNSRNIESKLAEAFDSVMKDLQKEGLFESVKSFDLDFNGKGINIKLNESNDKEALFLIKAMLKDLEEWNEQMPCEQTQNLITRAKAFIEAQRVIDKIENHDDDNNNHYNSDKEKRAAELGLQNWERLWAKS